MAKNKIKIKNLISVLMLSLCALFLTGCASVDYSRFIYPTGEITDKIVIELDAEKIAKAGYSNSDIKIICEQVKLDLENYYVFPVRKFVSDYVSRTDVSFDQKQAVSEGLISNAEIVGNKIYAEINYKSVEIFNLYYEIVPSDDDTSDIEFREGGFVNKYVQSSQNAYAALKTDALKQIIKKYETIFGGEFTLNDMKLTQVYASPNTDIKSNADATEVAQGIKMHQWEINPDNLDFMLEFYTVSPNTSTWYILALTTTLFVTFVIYCNIRSKKYKESIEKNNKIEK